MHNKNKNVCIIEFQPQMSAIGTPTTKKKDKEDEKEKKFLGYLSFKLDYDFDKNAVSKTRQKQAFKIYSSDVRII
uniref:Outer membrane beta-barrel protein n=1 Tax=Bursaphelenchus xylophilus TaxID=6326 RepID=A0A1I7RTB4_BURXY